MENKWPGLGKKWLFKTYCENLKNSYLELKYEYNKDLMEKSINSKPFFTWWPEYWTKRINILKTKILNFFQNILLFFSHNFVFSV